MTEFKSPRPSFEDPPVIEVLLGLQFSPLSGLQLAHVGLFWNLIRGDFVRTDTKPALVSQFESFAPSEDSGVALRPSFELITEYPIPRIWFMNASGTELFQIQPDRIVFNWRKTDSDPIYPRYEKVKARFVHLFEQFQTFVSRENLGAVIPNHCEVTYINHMEIHKNQSDSGAMRQIFPAWTGATSDGFLPEAEMVRFHSAYRIISEDQAIGRLHVNAAPRLRVKDRRTVIQAEITARGVPFGADLNGALQFFDLGREYVVRGFTSITSPEMHKQWRRIDA